MSLIVSVSDPANYPITSYEFRDNGASGGYFVLNGNKQSNGVWITVSSTQLDKLLYVGGSAAGSETVDIAAYDDHAWSVYKTSTVTTNLIQYAAPAIVAQDQTVSTNGTIQAATLLVSVTDPNGFTISTYGFWDEGSGGGYLSLNGVKQQSATWVNVSASDLSKLIYVGGSSAGNEKIDITAFNGQVWANYAAATVTTAAIAVPTVTALNKSVAADASILASSLIGSVIDPSNLPITSYGFKDEGTGGGYLSLDGVKQAEGVWITFDANQLQKLSYVGGSTSGSENIDIKVQDSNGWSSYAIANVLTQGTVVTNPVLAKLTDPVIKADVTSAVADNAISYAEMLKILNDVTPSGVTATEFADLKTLISYFNKTDGVSVTPYVYDITNKVVNGDPANQYWTGGTLSKVTLGNLTAGTSQTNMDRLVQKWFLGGDLPQPDFGSKTGTYVKFSNPLFGSSGLPMVTDINQLGLLGDCYLLASLAGVANCEPEVISSMILDNGNGTYGVRFYIQNKPVYVTVNQFLPVDATGKLLGNTSSNLWSSLIEKAYVELNEEPGYLKQTTGNVYKYIDGGLADPITEITGRSVTTYNSANYSATGWSGIKNTIVTAIQSGLEVDFGDLSSSTHKVFSSDGKMTFTGGHMFAGIGYDSVTGNFIIRNPWGVIAGQTFMTQFEASMSELYAEHGALFVADGSLGGMAFSTSFATTDTTPPVVISFAPTNSANNVPTSSDIVVNFDENVQFGSGSITIKTAVGTVVATYDAASSTNLSISGSTLTINPSADLGIFTGYQVEIAAGAIKDMAGNNYAGESNYNFTTQTLDSLYHFSVVAFSAAPGATFMGQMAEAYNAGMTVKQIVEVFSTKPQFTSTYADSMTNVDFATLLVANVVKDSASIATKTQAVNDIVSALTVWSRGETIYQIFGNLANMPLSNPDWGNTALQFNNQTAVARHFTEVMHNTTTDMPTLKAIVGSVTPNTDVSTPEHIATLIGIEVPGMH